MRALAQKAEMLSRKANGLRYAEMELNVTPRGKFFLILINVHCLHCTLDVSSTHDEGLIVAPD